MKKTKYLFSVILSGIAYGVAPALIAATYQFGGNGFNVAAYMAVLSLPIYFIIMKVKHISAKIDIKQFLKFALLGLLNISANLTLMLSYSYTSVGVATTLHFVYPVILAVILVIFCKEKITPLKIAALIISVAGIAFVSMDGQAEIRVIGLVLALLSGVLWACYMFYLERSKLNQLNPFYVGFYLAVNTMITTIPLMFLTGNFVVFSSVESWLYLLGGTLLMKIVGQVLFQIGIKGAGSLVTSILSTFEPLVSVVVGILFLKEGVSFGKLIGCFLIILGVLLIIWADSKKRVSEKAQQLKKSSI